VIAPDGISACGLVGLDLQTGKVLWHMQGQILGKYATPMAWRKDGRDYVLVANGEGTISCIQAATGELAWRYEEAGDNEYQPLLIGDMLIAHKMTKEQRETAPQTPDEGLHSAPGRNFGRVACWRLTEQGPAQLWEAPAAWGAPANCPIGSVAGGLACFRGNYSYHLVDPRTGRRIASRHLPEPVRWDEGHLLALPGLFILHPDSQHGHTKMFPFPARDDGEVGPLWSPPHPQATTYQSAMSHAWADGRLFIRGADAIYCYDLRKQ
jgi:outer membrane protein assembly factor BamB